ncbi:MAG TPA: ribosome recycling factor [Gammaproteobacteria bacterium]|nr:ribosome recycling factor [Gammaproteobacteria bacterium]
MIADIKKDAEHRMQKTIDTLKDEMRRLRTGRAHTGLLEHIMVEYYGSQVPIPRAATVSVEDSRTLTVSPWEKSMVSAIEKAILTSDLGLTPVSAGTVIRVPLPPMTEERRKDLVRVVRHEAENARVAIRNVRRDALSGVKELLKEKLVTEDEDRRAHDEIQKLTDRYVAQVDALLKEKEAEIMEF